MSFFVSEEIKDMIDIKNSQSDVSLKVNNDIFPVDVSKIKIDNEFINFECITKINIILSVIENSNKLSLLIKNELFDDIQNNNILISKKDNYYKIKFKVKNSNK